MSYPSNPFALLRVSTEASRNEIVKHSRELLEDAEDEALQLAYRKAVEDIISHPFDRLLQTMWEMPNTDYQEHEDAWRRFARAFQRNPVPLGKLQQTADHFMEANFAPDKLLDLLSPLLTVSRPSRKRPFTLQQPSEIENSPLLLESHELF